MTTSATNGADRQQAGATLTQRFVARQSVGTEPGCEGR
jgi:hypothetical protein